MEIAIEGLKPAKGIRCDRRVGQRCAPDFSPSGGGTAGGLGEVGQRVSGREWVNAEAGSREGR